MTIHFPSVAYPPSGDGYWNPVTSTLNWCEEDYYATTYAAEIVNTVTNLYFMYLAIRGLISCRRDQHDTIFAIAFAGFLVVGLGSFLFHATLKYPMQLVDELSMIYTACIMCYATFAFRKSRPFAIALCIALIALALFITLYYHYLQDPTFHQNAYALLTTIAVFRSMYVMEVSLRPSRRLTGGARPGRNEDGQPPEVHKLSDNKTDDQRNQKILESMWRLVACGLSIFLSGFVIWTLDNEYCSILRDWRRQIGLPWGIFLEGHGWWHLMTGTGAYFYIVWAIWLRHCLSGKHDDYHLRWPSLLFSLPEIVRVSDQPKNTDTYQTNSGRHLLNDVGVANGASKKVR
ncbi:MAG: hypothetical protein M1817_006933 [Caeruleum heppii]|nr:MAG: hypothetical protein M1817_006933 [Caeruleum heppii]